MNHGINIEGVSPQSVAEVGTLVQSILTARGASNKTRRCALEQLCKLLPPQTIVKGCNITMGTDYGFTGDAKEPRK